MRQILQTFQFLLTAVQHIDAVLVDGSKVCQHLHEFTEIDAIVGAVGEKCMHNSIAQRIYGQFGNAQKVFAWQCATIGAIQRCKTRIESLDLTGSDWKTKKEIYVLFSQSVSRQSMLIIFGNLLVCVTSYYNDTTTDRWKIAFYLHPVSSWICAISSWRNNNDDLFPILIFTDLLYAIDKQRVLFAAGKLYCFEADRKDSIKCVRIKPTHTITQQSSAKAAFNATAMGECHIAFPPPTVTFRLFDISAAVKTM